jgi:hypothetical protein
MLDTRAAHPVKLTKIAFVVLVVVALVLGIGGVILARNWPFSQARITQSLQESFPATVTFQKFRPTYFPHPGCIAEGLVFRQLGRAQDTPPIATVERITFEAHYIDILFRPGYLARIILNGFRVHVPPIGTPLEKSDWKETPSTTRVGEVFADGAVLEIARADPRTPLLFDIHTLKLSVLVRDKPISYSVSLHNPLPPGEIKSEGQFGPWNSADPGQTPVAGQYTFQNADLSVFDGIAGMLSCEDKFRGPLQRIEAQGRIDIPDFMVIRSKNAVHVTSDFHAFIDGINGDVDLDRVGAAFLYTRVTAKGKIAGQAGDQHGKTASLDLIVREGRIQDVLRLFVRGPKAPMNGVTTFRAHVVWPPDDRPFLQKIRVTGDFGVAGGQFTKSSTQTNVDDLSEKARGVKPDTKPDDTKLDAKPQDEDPDRVISNLAGHVELLNATATFTDLAFAVPGAFTHMHGTYNLDRETIDLHGTLKTDAEFSQMSGGVKSVLLKPFNVFFKRKHAGAIVPVRLTGTYEAPQAGLDLPVK